MTIATEQPIFNPTDVSPSRLDQITVGRAAMLDRITSRLVRLASSQSRPHTLIVGPRGSGKTHLMTVALHRAKQDPLFTSNVLTLQLPEDAPGVNSYRDLLVALARRVDDPTGRAAVELRAARDTIGLQQLLTRAAAGRVLLFALENLDRIFESLRDEGQRGLRGFVETSGQLALLATTPALFPSITLRSEPWFGAFDAEHLTKLELADGTELVRRSALDRGDTQLAAFVGSSTGQARLAALQRLTAGSPRLWHVLASTLTINSLDVLIPAVRAMLDRLTPYYQSQLSRLSGVEEVIVVELARLSGAATVTDIATIAGLDRATTNTTVKRLSDDGWIQMSKIVGTDQRKSWYELREPLLRHYLSYREASGGTLDMIVGILSIWFSRAERVRFLAHAGADSTAAQHLIGSLGLDPPQRSDSFYAERSLDTLVAAARCWIAGRPAVGNIRASKELGLAVERLVLDAMRGGEVARSTPSATSNDQSGYASSAADLVGVGLHVLSSQRWPESDGDIVDLMDACWNCEADPSRAVQILTRIAARRQDGLDELTLLARDELAYRRGESGEFSVATDLYADLITDRTRVLGPDHPDTLSSRNNFASFLGASGKASLASELFYSLVHDATRILGSDDPDTLTTRNNYAFWTGRAGDPEAAREAYLALAADRSRLSGSDHPTTLITRMMVADWTGIAGDVVQAREQFSTLVQDFIRVRGADHADTLTARYRFSHWTGHADINNVEQEQLTALVGDLGRLRLLKSAIARAAVTRLAWLLLVSGSDFAPLIAAVGEQATKLVIGTSLGDAPSKEAMLEAVGRLQDGDGVAGVVAALVLMPGLNASDRHDVITRASANLSAETIRTAAQISAALAGDAEALARLPKEIRDLLSASAATAG